MRTRTAWRHPQSHTALRPAPLLQERGNYAREPFIHLNHKWEEHVYPLNKKNSAEYHTAMNKSEDLTHHQNKGGPYKHYTEKATQ